MADKKVVGARSVSEVAEKMGVNRTRVIYLTSSLLRKVRWPNRLQAVKRFLDEYNG
jgi:preprotein translocase subunit SecE